jgi:hypothetical protein
MSDILDTILLLALPASGKSEVRKYLAHLTPEECRRDFHMGPTVQLDDFPYVHLMRQIDLALLDMKKPPVFFKAPDRPFQDSRDWGTLIELINEDYRDLKGKNFVQPKDAAVYVAERIDQARAKVSAPRFWDAFGKDTQQAVAKALLGEATTWLKDKHAGIPDTLNGKTLVIEFARGGPQGASLPLPDPLGYQYSIPKLAPEILAKAGILYIWVTPEESRRKNDARANPDDPGSILHHGVPIEVMLQEYGLDDMDYLEKNSGKANHIRVKAQGKDVHLPIARFDNREDKTTFVREDRSRWAQANVKALHEGLAQALASLHRNRPNAG